MASNPARETRGWGVGSRFGVWDLGFGVWGLGFGVWGLGFEVEGVGCRGSQAFRQNAVRVAETHHYQGATDLLRQG